MTESSDGSGCAPGHPAFADDGQITWDARCTPRSRRFDDIYYSSEDGLAESRATFLVGCNLPAAWRGRSHFTVAETGFGTGLNIAALLDLWNSARPTGAVLTIHSIEAFPLQGDAVDRALSAWPNIRSAADAIIGAYPKRSDTPTPGRHSVRLGSSVTLVLHIAEVEDALRSAHFQADAWFLDGFAPAKNPDMWRPSVLSLIGERSAPGARVATFTAAGVVRRGLADAGFEVNKAPGFGRKRERLVGTYDGPAAV